MLTPESTRPISRRDALRIAAVAAAAIATGCRQAPSVDRTKRAPGRLLSRPSFPKFAPNIGGSRLGLASGSGGLFFLPAALNAPWPAPPGFMAHRCPAVGGVR